MLGSSLHRLARGVLVTANPVMLRPLAGAAADLDLARLHRLGDLAHQLNRQEAVPKVGTAHLDVVGQREAALERAVSDAAVDVVGTALLIVLALAAGDDQHVLLRSDVDLAGLETGDRQLDSVLVVTILDQVERRVVFLAAAEARILEHVEQPVEADAGTAVGRKVGSATHVFVLLSSNKAERGPAWSRSPRHRTHFGVRRRKFWYAVLRFQEVSGKHQARSSKAHFQRSPRS